MKEKIANKLIYVGAGVGLVLFAFLGLLPGSFVGGVMGLSISGMIFGTPVEPGIISRIIIAISMLLGVMVSGFVFVTAASTLGWLVGTIIDTLRAGKEKEEAKAQIK
jgi:hypothetical protein